jgi:hypothetical protein
MHTHISYCQRSSTHTTHDTRHTTHDTHVWRTKIEEGGLGDLEEDEHDVGPHEPERVRNQTLNMLFHVNMLS